MGFEPLVGAPFVELVVAAELADLGVGLEVRQADQALVDVGLQPFSLLGRLLISVDRQMRNEFEVSGTLRTLRLQV